MAEMINKFYVNIGRSVEEKIPNGKNSFSHYLRDRNAFSIVLNPCTPEEVKKYVLDLSSSKASGPNSIPTSILKNNVDLLIEPLTSILNKSLTEGTFPDMLKLTSVKIMTALNVLIIALSDYYQI